MKKREIKKLLALVLCFSLVFAMAVPSFAEVGVSPVTYKGSSADTINYVSIGDSMTNGYGFNGWLVTDNDWESRTGGFKVSSDVIYPTKFAKYLNEKGSTVNYYPFAANCLRAEELLYILTYGDEDAYEGDGYTKNELEWRITDYFYKDDVAYDSEEQELQIKTKKMHDEYTDAIEKADVITLFIGLNSFARFLLDRVDYWSGGENAEDEFNLDINQVVGDTYGDLYTKYKGKIDSLLKEKLGNVGIFSERISNDLVYCVLSFMKCYTECVEKIREINPDVYIINIGFNNGAEDMILEANLGDLLEMLGKDVSLNINPSIDVGDVYGAVMDMANTYLKAETVSDNLKSSSKGGAADYISRSDSNGLLYQDVGKLDPDNIDLDTSQDTYNALDYYYTFEITEHDDFKELKNAIYKLFYSADPTDDYWKYVDQAIIAGSVDKAISTGQLSSEMTDDEKNKINKGVGIIKGIRAAVIETCNYKENGKEYNVMNAVNLLKYYQDKTEYEKLVEANKTTITGSEDLAGTIKTMLLTTDAKDMVFLEGRLLIGSYGCHTSAAEHQVIYEKIKNTYEKHLKSVEVKSALKKAVPVVVGGVAVALITSSVVKKLKANSDASLSGVDSSVTDESEGTEASEGSTFMEKLSQAITTLKEKFAELIEKIKAGNTYEFIYQRNE